MSSPHHRWKRTDNACCVSSVGQSLFPFIADVLAKDISLYYTLDQPCFVSFVFMGGQISIKYHFSEEIINSILHKEN